MKSKQMRMIMGYPCSGKSTIVKCFEELGYKRWNRDDRGGSLNGMNLAIEEELAGGFTGNIVLDNTYGTKEQRKPIVELAKKYGYDLICEWLDTSIEDAQFNSAWRILDEFFKPPTIVLGPDGSKQFPSPDHVPVIALYAYKKSFEAPKPSEGFGVTITKFVRNFPKGFTNKAILLDYDGTLRKMKGKLKYPTDPDDVEILPNRKKVLREWKDKGYKLLGVSNQSGVEKGNLTNAQACACFRKTNELLGHDIDFEYCPHHSFPIRCYCRKPLSGIGVYFIKKYKLNPSECIVVGDSKSDSTFAKRCGFQFVKAEEFFKC